MPDYKYLIVGGGMTADAAARGIRAVDADGSIGLLSAEPDPPYNRPPLSKGLWKGKDPGTIWRGTADLGVELHLGRKATELDVEGKRVRDDQGEVYAYEKVLLATGGTPRRLSQGDDSILYFRSWRHYQRLKALADSKNRFAVIGGGFIGSELAAALSMHGKQVTMIFPEEGIGGVQFPPDLSRFLNDYYREKGVEVLAGELVDGVAAEGEGAVLRLRSGKEVRADGVVAGLGIRPNVELAQAAGLEVGNGILVDAALRAGNPDVFAAGDVANFYNPALGMRMRVEHEDNANTMGEMAGRSMAGEEVHYDHLPYFYSDLFDLGYEAVGRLDAKMESVADWSEPFRKGVVYFLNDGRVRGALLWDVWGKVDAARALIAEPDPFTAGDLQGRIEA